MSENLWQKATRLKYRFAIGATALSLEQLWDLPLTSTKAQIPNTAPVADLDTIARGINRQIKDLAEESFVDTAKNNPLRAELEDKLALVKAVIQYKLDAADKRAAAAEKQERRRQLAEALAGKRQEELLGKSAAEIEAELAKLDSED
jgi:hypothetical protein